MRSCPTMLLSTQLMLLRHWFRLVPIWTALQKQRELQFSHHGWLVATAGPDQRPSPQSATPASRRRILKEAVLRRSGGLPCPEPGGNPSPRSDVAASPQLSLAGTHSVDLPSPCSLFPLTTLIMGDSITRNIHFFNAATHFLPGAMVPVILGKLAGLLGSLPSCKPVNSPCRK